MSVNPERGEVEVALTDQSPLPMRPSFEAIQAIERDLDTTLQSLAGQASTFAFLSLEQIGVILYHGIVAAGKDRDDVALKMVQKDKLMRLAFETGVTNLQAPIGQFLINALTGGKKPRKKDQASQARLSATG